MRSEMRIRTGWRFARGDARDAWARGFDDSAWEEVCVPHDWSIAGPFGRENSSGTGYLPGGTAWYRGRFLLPESERGRRVELVFDGVYKHARVYVNGYHLGGRAGGYVPFGFDITPFTRFGSEGNVVSVRVEHDDTADSRWYTGSGIYRDVHVVLTGPVRFVRDGLSFTVLRADGDGAEAEVSAEIENGAPGRAEGVCTFRLVKDGVCAAQAQVPFAAEPGGTALAKGTLLAGKCRLWSSEDPQLYRLECEIASSQGGDSLSRSVGLRTFRFDSEKGLFVNGRSEKLRGVCVHHDAGCLGAAVTKEVWARRLSRLKEMGCNAIRMSHNPMMNELYDLCDEMGFYVMDEAFDEWENGKNKWWQGHNVYPPRNGGYAEDFPQWHERDLRDMVRRDRLHPSILLWSIGNEIDYPNDPYCSKHFLSMTGNNDTGKPAQEMLYSPDKPDASRIPAVAEELKRTVKENDASRPVCAAVAFPELSNLTGYCGVLDVCGYNYKEMHYDRDHALFPDRVLLGSENSSEYRAWASARDREFIAGQFVWTGIDYLGEAKGWPVHGSASGFLDLAGTRKASWYVRRSWWTDCAETHLFVRRAADGGRRLAGFRHDWDLEEGEEAEVLAVSRGGVSRITLNGEGAGERIASRGDDGYDMWILRYAPGRLEAVSADGTSDALETPGKARQLRASWDGCVPADGIAHVEIVLADENGRRVPDGRLVRAHAEGAAFIAGLENGDLADDTAYSCPARRAADGRLLLYLRGRGEKGTVRLRLEAEGLEGFEAHIPVG